MIKRIRQWFRRAQPAPVAPASQSRADKYVDESALHGMLKAQQELEQQRMAEFTRSAAAAFDKIMIWQPSATGAMDASEPLLTLRSAMDDSNNGLPPFKQVLLESGSQMALLPWFMRHGFIGYQNCAFLAQHWLIYKACATPVDDAIRNGYDITTDTGEDLPEDALKILKRFDRKIGIKAQLRDFGTKGRIFGIRIALFEVESKDPDYYQKPFNIDGVTPHSYKGISQVDPYWCAPILDITSAAVPSARHFYEPTWWLIGSRRVHRSHLVIFRYADPADVMKPLYLFGGVPLSQMIMERVYAAERTANEAPALALSKRTTVWLTDMSKVMADPVKAQAAIADWIAYRDNFGIKIGDKEGDDFQQFDTNVSDFDGLVMTQYGLVAATAGCPITKLMGSSPGGFQATGEYDEASYHEMEESMQERDFSPLVERHHALVMRSEVLPKFEELADVEVLVKWHELDALTHIEQSTVNLNKAQTGAALIASGALSPADEHARVAADKESGYHGIGVDIGTEELPEDVDRNAAASAAGTGSRVEKAIVKKDKGESDGAAHDAYDPSEKRVPKGQSKGGQWTTSNPGSGYSQNKKGEWRTAQGGAVPKEHAARLKKLGVPPPWTDVRLNPSRSAALQAVGRDSKGKLQPRYTAKHSSAAAAEKFDRLKSFNAKAPKIRERAYADLADAKKSTKERDAAAVTALISRTGFRVGGEGGGGDVKAFGASSLRAAHVKIDGDQIAFRFPGKKGVMQNHRLVDKPLAAYIQARKKEVGQGRLFEVRDYNVRDYVHSTGGDKFKVHDFRTWVATTTAIAAIKKISPPRDAKRLKAKKKEVAKIVARKLGNNPSEALKSYIDPMVFSEWENLV